MNRLERALSMLLAVAIFFTCSAVNVFAQSQTEILPQYIEVSEFVSTQSSSVVSKSISRYNVISNQNPKHIISVARGQTIEMELTTDLEFSYTASAEAAIDVAVKASFGLSTTGKIKFQFRGKVTYQGSSAPYNVRDYYAAVSYDEYKIVLRNYNKYNVYRVENGKKTFVRTEYSYTTETKYINIPKKATYSHDA